jgi:nitrogen PTS system EIIA component
LNISDFLSNRDVLIGVSASDKVRLLRQLSTDAANELGLDPNNVSEAVARREALGSTGVGIGVALPHARVSNLKQPFGLLARLKHGIDFEAVDDQPVDIVFLLLIPEAADSAQLNALACIARKLRDPEALRDVRRAADRESLFEAVAQPSVTS